MRKKYDLTFAEAQDLEAKTNIDTYWNDGDIVIEESHITQTVGNVLQFGMDYQKAIDDAEKQAMIDKAVDWLDHNINQDLSIGDYTDTIQSLEDDLRRTLEDKQ